LHATPTTPRTARNPKPIKPKKPPNIHPNLPKSTQSQQKNKPKNTKKPELHLKSKPKIQIKPQLQKKSHSYSQEKRKKLQSVACGAIVASAALNQPEKLSDIAESAGKPLEGRMRGKDVPNTVDLTPKLQKTPSATARGIHPQQRQ
jgi:hypothetical protein